MKVLKNLDEAIELLKAGQIGVIPTDTVYGLVASAADKAAVTRLYGLKKRDHKPGTLIAANIDQFAELGIPRRYLKAVEQYWPNPISVIVPATFELMYIHLGKLSVAVRMPKGSMSNFLKGTGPLLTTSANLPGEPVAVTLKQAQKCFGDTVDFYVDGGDLSDHEASTIIRVVDDIVEVVREGAVKINEKGEIIQ